MTIQLYQICFKIATLDSVSSFLSGGWRLWSGSMARSGSRYRPPCQPCPEKRGWLQLCNIFSGRKCRTPAKSQEYGSFCITYHILHLPIGPFRPQPQSPTAAAMVTEMPHGAPITACPRTGVQQLNKGKIATGRIKPVFLCQIL